MTIKVNLSRRVDVTLPGPMTVHLDNLDPLYGLTDQDRIRAALRIALPLMARQTEGQVKP